MIKRVVSIMFLIAAALAVSTTAKADIKLIDSNFGFSETAGSYTEGNVESGAGSPGDFEIIFTATLSAGSNSFNSVTPGDWSGLDQGGCGSDNHCILGIFTRFDGSPENTELTFDWNVPTDLWLGASLRYSGTDPENPVIDYECNTGYGTYATAPSVVTEPRSTVIRVAVFAWDYSVKSVDINGLQNGEPEELFGGLVTTVNEILYLKGTGQEFPKGGPTGEAELYGIYPQDWRACTIALRAAPTNIPTLSEWGMIASAAGLMLIGVYFALKRKKIQVI